MEEDKTLNTEFAGKTRKLVFWYDEKGEFAEDIDAGNAKIYKLKKVIRMMWKCSATKLFMFPIP